MEAIYLVALSHCLASGSWLVIGHSAKSQKPREFSFLEQIYDPIETFVTFLSNKIQQNWMYKPVGFVKTTDVVTKSSRVEFYGFSNVPHVHNRVSKRRSHHIRRHSFQSFWFWLRSDPSSNLTSLLQYIKSLFTVSSPRGRLHASSCQGYLLPRELLHT